MSNAQNNTPRQPHPISGHGQKDFSVDMQSLWDKHHQEVRRAQLSTKPHEFALSIGQYLQSATSTRLKVLELGSGMGSDATYFASLGATVTAVDFSDVAIRHNTENNAYPKNLKFEMLDISKPMPYAAETYDAVYAHLSLHYFGQETTENIFAEVARVLKPNGMFYFACESASDPEYGEGYQVEPGVFLHKDGHARHFFSVPYTQDLVSKRFDMVKLEEGQGMYRGEPSAFVYCWAKKKAI